MLFFLLLVIYLLMHSVVKEIIISFELLNFNFSYPCNIIEKFQSKSYKLMQFGVCVKEEVLLMFSFK